VGAHVLAANEFTFGPFRLDLANRKLFRATIEVPLKSRAFEVLAVLAEAHGREVCKDEILEKVWPGTIVEENNLQVHISALRKALGEPRERPVHLFTIPGRGYRLVGIQSDDSLRARPVQTDSNAAAVADRPSIAVLPFQNMSSDPNQEYFADGMVEDIANGLSRIKWLSVTGRTSSFAYKQKSIDLRQIGRELGVRYLLEGSVRKADDRVRISARLVEAETGTQVWSERYDRLLTDIFAVQDEIAMNVIGAIEPGLRNIELERVRRKQPGNFDAYDLVLQALPYIYSLMPEGSAPAIPLLERALILDPTYAFAHAGLAWCFHIRFSRAGLDPEDKRRSILHAHKAVSGAQNDATTLAIAAFVIWFDEHDARLAFDLFDRALDISGSNVIALCTSAVALAWSGSNDLALERAQRALKVSPFDSLRYLSYQAISGANFNLGRYAKAVAAGQRAVEANPSFSVPYAYLAAALVRTGQIEDARRAALALLQLDKNFRIGRFQVTVGVNPDVFSSFAEAWGQAGLPA
jgi:TolB-like protein/Tfp pilus assembly protein PilF